MNFTREPIIETIITPKEGHKLVLRNTKGMSHEEYCVDAVEVVSFGQSIFYRSLERPKSFLVPVADFEIVEAKETRVVLKSANLERAIKIGGGRDAAPKKPANAEQDPAAVEQKLEKKRERRRHRRKRGGAVEDAATEVEGKPADEVASEEEAPKQVKQEPTTLIRQLIPPPQSLIADKIAKERAELLVIESPIEDVIDGDGSPKVVAAEEEEKPTRRRKKAASSRKDKEKSTSEEASAEEETSPPPQEEKLSEGEGSEMQMVAIEEGETVGAGSFSTPEKKGKTSFFGKIW